MAKRDYKDLATDEVYLVVTVNKKTTSIRLLQPKIIRFAGPALAPNEYAYKFKIITDFKKWEDRIITHTLPPVNPPARPVGGEFVSVIGESVEEKVTKALTK
jgi:hypothetical protein